MPASKHIILHSVGSWGHNKPFVPLALRIIEAHQDVVITMLTSPSFRGKILHEIETKVPLDEKDVLSARFNVIDVSGEEGIFYSAFVPSFEALWKGEPLRCRSSGNVFNLPKPTVAIIDVFALYALDGVRSITGSHPFPIISWYTAPTSSALRHFGPRYLGGETDQSIETKEGLEAARKDLQSGENKLVHGYEPTGELVEIPGVPVMYDYEFEPQIIPFPKPESIMQGGRIFFRDTDGVMIVSSSGFVKESEDAAHKWMESLGKVWLPIGPLSLPHSTSSSAPHPDRKVTSFLDVQPRQSVVYIAFGSMFWPQEPEKFHAVIKELIALEIPFILAQASPFASAVPDDVAKKIEESGIGLMLKWAPQEIILSHPSVGWFITHGGWNSLQEAMHHKVPMILWPFATDQPLNAAILAINRKAAFELIEVRTGESGTRRPHRCKEMPAFTVESVRNEIRALVSKIRGEEGKIVRANVEQLSGAMDGAWDEGGEARLNLDIFIEKFVA